MTESILVTPKTPKSCFDFGVKDSEPRGRRGFYALFRLLSFFPTECEFTQGVKVMYEAALGSKGTR